MFANRHPYSLTQSRSVRRGAGALRAWTGVVGGRLDNGTIGVFAANGDGSAVDCIPNDPATSSTTGVSQRNSPLEWDFSVDDDQYTSPFAWIGTP